MGRGASYHHMDFVEVDGSYGEGGGQILRTAATLSVILGKPTRVTAIRAGRKAPGLRQQHASALEILRQMSHGRLDGAKVGSTEVTLHPGRAAGGSCSFNLETAASITLVLQAAVPAAALSGAKFSFDLVGGTDVPWSPTYDYFATVVRRAFAKMGIMFSCSASRRGYYPRGGGRVSAEVEPSESVKPLVMERPSSTLAATLTSRCSMLPRHVAQRQLDSAAANLARAGVAVAGSAVEEGESDSPGTSVLVCAMDESRIVGADSIGARGKRAEEVGSEAADRFAAEAKSGACLDSNLADMVSPILALSKAPSKLRVSAMTPHLETSLYVAGLFTGCKWSVERQGRSCVLTLSPGDRAS
jgi:RNA 3'-phosphate cyclase